jgi:uncharacterized protein (DUF1499 family)
MIGRGGADAADAKRGIRMGLFSGRRPSNLGAKDGKLAPPNARPNNVSSQTDRAADPSHYIDPLAFKGDPKRAFTAAKDIVRQLERTVVVVDQPEYLHAEAASKTFGFVDDLELLLDRKAKRIHVRAAARAGIRDFGVNRERIEQIRRRLTDAGV